MNPTPPQTAAKRYQRNSLLLSLSALLTVIAVYGGYRLYLAHKVKVKIGQIRQAGLPVTTAELNQWYAAVPPEKNMALILTNAFAHLVRVNTNTPNLPIIGRGKLPARNEALPPEMREAIANYVATNNSALKLLRQVPEMESCRYPVDMTPGWEALLPHLVGLKESAQLLTLNALLHVDKGETDEAAELLERMLRLADTVGKEPLLVSHLVRISCYQLSYQCLERILCRGPLSDDALRKFSAFYRHMDGSDGLERGVVSHLCFGLQCFDFSVARLQKFLTDTIDYSAFDVWIMRVSGHLDQDELYFLGCIEAYRRAAQLDLPDRLDAAQKVNERVRVMKGSKSPYILSGMFLPGLGNAFKRDAVHIASLRAAQAVLTVERYRLIHGNRLPETLRETVPDLSQELSTDPFDGELLRYKRRSKGEGYIVYSVGPDGEDNGGEDAKPLNNAQRLAGGREPSDTTFTVTR